MTPGIQGTIAYLAPEQLRCEPADGRADLYSLGVVFYELASGRRPFSAPTVGALISQIISGSAPRLKDAAPGAPPRCAPSSKSFSRRTRPSLSKRARSAA